VVGNYSAHKSEGVKDSLTKQRGGFVLHWISTHSSWLNSEERWFAEITNKAIRRESWTGVCELKQSIAGFIRIWNDSGKKLPRVKTSGQIKELISHASTRYAERRLQETRTPPIRNESTVVTLRLHRTISDSTSTGRITRPFFAILQRRDLEERKVNQEEFRV